MNQTIRFTAEDANKAGEEWGFNCGPGALCGVLVRTPDEMRPFMGDFEEKRYTNPTLMFEVLNRLGVSYRQVYRGDVPSNMLPLDLGLVRIQWEGSWTREGVPMRARYRATHWIGVRAKGAEIFDVNATCVGGWIDYPQWRDQLVPWLLKECVPKATGGWWPTHGIEIKLPTDPDKA